MRMTWHITIWLGGSISASFLFLSSFSLLLPHSLFLFFIFSSFPFSNSYIPIPFCLNCLLYHFGDAITDVSDVMLI